MTQDQPRTEILPGEHRQPWRGEWLPEGSTGTARAATSPSTRRPDLGADGRARVRRVTHRGPRLVVEPSAALGVAAVLEDLTASPAVTSSPSSAAVTSTWTPITAGSVPDLRQSSLIPAGIRVAGLCRGLRRSAGVGCVVGVTTAAGRSDRRPAPVGCCPGREGQGRRHPGSSCRARSGSERR